MSLLPLETDFTKSHLKNLNKNSVFSPTNIINCFTKNAMYLLKNKRFKELLELVEMSLKEYPFCRQKLNGIYVSLINDSHGTVEEAKEIIKLFVSTTTKLQNIGTKSLGLPLILETNWMLTRMGEMVDQTAYTYHIQKLGLLKEKPILCLATGVQITNAGFIPYLSDSFDVITDDKQCAYFQSISYLCPFNPSFFQYGSEIGHNGRFLNAAYDDLISNGIDPYPLKLKEITKNEALNFLKPFGLNEDDDFIVLHLREEGYADGAQHTYRNVDIQNYIDSIDWLINQGFKVVRIGHPHMSRIEPRNGLIDLTAVRNPGEVDIFLCARAKFYYGSGSGPVSLAFNFNVPCLITNNLPYGHQRPNGLVQFVPLIQESTGKPLSLEQIRKMKLEHTYSPKIFNDLKLTPKFASSADNLRLVREMVEYIQHGEIFKQNCAKKEKLKEYGILCGLDSKSLSLLT